MIIGIGTDIIDIRRVEKIWAQYGARFENRMLSSNEQKKLKTITGSQKRVSYFAKRIAAKEAYSKALGTGIGKTITFKEISVENESSGRPVINLTPPGENKIHISISDDYPYAQSFVVISKE